MKYKVGDIVRVRNDLKLAERYGTEHFIGKMEMHIGKDHEVIAIKYKKGYELKGCEGYVFTEEMIEKLVFEYNPKPSIQTASDKDFIIIEINKEATTEKLIQASKQVKELLGINVLFTDGKVVYNGYERK